VEKQERTADKRTGENGSDWGEKKSRPEICALDVTTG